MDSFFMVDSSLPANHEVQPGLTLLDDVKQWAGGPPRAWGRYLGDGGGAATPLTKEEVAFLHAAGVDVLLIFNDAGTSTVSAGYEAGVADARSAIAQCDALGVPDGVYVIADLEYGWPVSDGWMGGWLDTMRASRLAGAGGFYGNLNADYFAGPWTRCLQGNWRANALRAVLWDADWKAPEFTAGALPAWAADVTPNEADCVFIWQARGGSYGDVVDLSVIRLPLPGPGSLWTPPASVPAEAPSSPQEPPQNPEPTPAPPTEPAAPKAAQEIEQVIGELQHVQAELSQPAQGA